MRAFFSSKSVTRDANACDHALAAANVLISIEFQKNFNGSEEE